MPICRFDRVVAAYELAVELGHVHAFKVVWSGRLVAAVLPFHGATFTNLAFCPKIVGQFIQVGIYNKTENCLH